MLIRGIRSYLRTQGSLLPRRNHRNILWLGLQTVFDINRVIPFSIFYSTALESKKYNSTIKFSYSLLKQRLKICKTNGFCSSSEFVELVKILEMSPQHIPLEIVVELFQFLNYCPINDSSILLKYFGMLHSKVIHLSTVNESMNAEDFSLCIEGLSNIPADFPPLQSLFLVLCANIFKTTKLIFDVNQVKTIMYGSRHMDFSNPQAAALLRHLSVFCEDILLRDSDALASDLASISDLFQYVILCVPSMKHVPPKQLDAFMKIWEEYQQYVSAIEESEKMSDVSKKLLSSENEHTVKIASKFMGKYKTSNHDGKSNADEAISTDVKVSVQHHVCSILQKRFEMDENISIALKPYLYGIHSAIVLEIFDPNNKSKTVVNVEIERFNRRHHNPARANYSQESNEMFSVSSNPTLDILRRNEMRFLRDKFLKQKYGVIVLRFDAQRMRYVSVKNISKRLSSIADDSKLLSKEDIESIRPLFGMWWWQGQGQRSDANEKFGSTLIIPAVPLLPTVDEKN